MSDSIQRGLFVVGTDTGVGKTYVAAEIARACVRQGHRVAVYKPVLSGWSVDQREQADDWLLWQAAGCPGRFEDVCPQRFSAPLAPPLAAAAESRAVDESLLVEGVKVFGADGTGSAANYDLILVEGAGGLMSPISKNLYVADVAAEMKWPLIVVAPNRLGVINHTLQTVITAATFRDGLEIAGVILNDVQALDLRRDPSCQSNAAAIKQYCVPPLLAHLAHRQSGGLDAIDWLKLADEFAA